MEPELASSGHRRRIGVDLALLSDLDGLGQARRVATDVVSAIVESAPDWAFVLFVGSRPNLIAAANVETVPIQPDALSGRSWLARARRDRLVRALRCDVLWCPSGVSVFKTRRVRRVLQVYDLDFLIRRGVIRHLRQSDSIVCLAERTRARLLQVASELRPQRVHTIVPARPPSDTTFVSANPALGEFVLSVSDGAVGDNHEMLLTAFGMFRGQHATSRLRLVCAGVPVDRMSRLRRVVECFRLADYVTLLETRDAIQVRALLAGGRALIVPTLSDTFQPSAVDAVWLDKPVLCSAQSSCADMTSDPRLCFDARRPRDIARVLGLVDNQDPLLAIAAAAARQHLVTTNTETSQISHYRALLAQS